ncbi:MAG: hypothetical protein U0610_19805 [bacterium]
MASGLVNLVSGAGFVFRWNLVLHPLLGFLAFALVLRLVFRRVDGEGSRVEAAAGLGLMILAAIAPARAWVLDRLATDQSDWVDGRVVLPAAVVGASLLARGLASTFRDKRARVASLAGLVAIAAWLAAAALGLVILIPATGRHDLEPFASRTLTGTLIGLVGWVTAACIVLWQLFLSLGRRLRMEAARMPLSLWIGLSILFALVPVRKAVMVSTSLPRDAVDGRISLPVLVVGAVFVARGLLKRGPAPEVRRSALGLVVWTAPLLVVVSMAWLVILRISREHDRHLYNVHTVWGLVAIGSAALVGRAAGSGGSGAFAGAWRGAAIAVGALVALVLGESWLPAGPGDITVVASVGRGAAEAAEPPLARAAADRWLQLSGSCAGEGGCHAEIVAESHRSLHGSGAHALAAPREESPLATSPGCVACHAPSAPAGELAAPRSDARADAIDCVLCHRIADVAVDPPWESSYTVSLTGGLLGPYRDAVRERRGLGAFDRYTIGLNGAAHGRAFSPAVLAEDRVCQTCHHLQIRVLVAGIRCVDCHMPAATALGGAGAHKSHLFPGANLAAAVRVGDEALASAQSAWALGACVASAPRPRDVPGEAETPLPAEALREPCLPIALALSAPVPGRARLAVTTSNPWMTHPFPAGSIDRLEAWLEVRVRDEDGRTVFASGLLDDAGRLGDDAHRLGTVVRAPGAATGPSPQRAPALWHGTSSSGARVILPGDSQTEEFEWDAPSPLGVLEVSVRWLYRKTDASHWQAEGGMRPVPVLVAAQRAERLAFAVGGETG